MVRREFYHKGKKLVDPDSDMTPDDVREFYASQHPELTNAAVSEAKETAEGIKKYDFTVSVGRKG